MSSFNGSGLFTISGSGLPYVTGTTISSTVANQLNTDLANGLSTCILKDGTQTITANIPMSGFKITGLPTATTTGDALSYNRRIVGLGTATNDDATTGQIGEYISAAVLRGSGASYTTTVTHDIASISLTAGDWDVSGFAGATVSGGTMTQLAGGAGSTSATLPTIGQNGLVTLQNISSTGDICTSFSGRLSLASTTTIYLMGAATFTGSAADYGFIGARRAR